MEHMSVNTHPEVAPPVLYVPIDQRPDGEYGFSLAHMFNEARVLLAYTSSIVSLTDWAKRNHGASSKRSVSQNSKRKLDLTRSK